MEQRSLSFVYKWFQFKDSTSYQLIDVCRDLYIGMVEINWFINSLLDCCYCVYLCKWWRSKYFSSQSTALTKYFSSSKYFSKVLLLQSTAARLKYCCSSIDSKYCSIILKYCSLKVLLIESTARSFKVLLQSTAIKVLLFNESTAWIFKVLLASSMYCSKVIFFQSTARILSRYCCNVLLPKYCCKVIWFYCCV